MKETADVLCPLCLAQGECDEEQQLIIAQQSQQLSQLLGCQPVPVFQGNVSTTKENWCLSTERMGKTIRTSGDMFVRHVMAWSQAALPSRCYVFQAVHAMSALLCHLLMLRFGDL